MTALIDTTALLALLDGHHPQHHTLRHEFAFELDVEGEIAITNYVALETFDAIRRRLGASALHLLAREIMPALDLVWVEPTEHALSLEMLLASGLESLSLVDRTTLVVARRLGVRRCIAADERFVAEGLA
jgi:predicted nucleic acid-binding protein